jgi:exosome complex component RRP41
MRANNRNPDSIRDINLVLNPVGPNSCLWEQGDTHVIVNLSRFKNLIFLDNELKSESSLKYRYAMCNFSVENRIIGRPYSQKRSIEISKVSSHIFQNLLFLKQYSKEKFYICADVLYADGSTRAAAINASTVCLASSGLCMKGYATSISFGKFNQEILVDLDGKEDKQGDADCVITLCKPHNTLLMIQMQGYLTKQEFLKGLDLALKQSEKIYKIQKRLVQENEI